MLVFVSVLTFLGLTGSTVWAEMTSTNYEIRFDHLGNGGNDTSSSATYQLRDTIGANAIDPGSSTSYELTGGFRDGVFDEVATFELFMMNSGTQVAASSLASTTISVSSSSGYAAGDMIALVQNEGVSQVAAVAKVTSTGAGTIDVDSFSPTSPTIDGSDDYVYNLSSSSLSLGTLSSSSVSTKIIAWEVDADVDDGYGVYVFEDEDLSNPSYTSTIVDVADGSVTAGVSEYGAISSDSSLASSSFDTADTNFTTSPQLVASRSSFAMDSRDFITLKAAIDAVQIDGNYSHNLSFIYVGDY